jgi:hypothetical protein
MTESIGSVMFLFYKQYLFQIHRWDFEEKRRISESTED